MFLFILLLCVCDSVKLTTVKESSLNGHGQEIVKVDQNMYRLDKIICATNGTLQHSTQLFFKSNLSNEFDGNKVKIKNCTNGERVKLLLEEQNVNGTIEIVKIKNIDQDLTKETFNGFKLKRLEIEFASSDENDKITRDFSFLENVTTLTSLYIKNAHLKSLPKNNLKEITLNNCMLFGKFENCEKLEWMNLIRCNLSNIEEDWLSVCAIKTLVVEDHPALKSDVLGKVLKGILKELEVLKVNRCHLEDLDIELRGADKLKLLDLSHNQLHSVLTRTALPSLVHLDVSHNHFFSSALLASGIERQQGLKWLSLDHNPFLNMCDLEGYFTGPFDDFSRVHQPISGRELKMPELEWLSVTTTATRGLCFHKMTLDSLKYLDVSNNTMYTFQLLGIPRTNGSLTINVTNTKIEELPFAKEEYDNLEQKINLIGLNSSLSSAIDCECSNQWLHLALVKGRLITNVPCKDGGDFIEKDKESVLCDKWNCAESCTCTRSWSTNRTAARCDGLTSLCGLPNVHELHARDNKVRNMNLSCLPDSIEYIDLSGNQVSRCSRVPQVYSRLRLARNPILCDCENAQCVGMLQEFQGQIEDYSTLQCEDGQLLSTVWPRWLCSTWRWPLISAMMSLAVAAAAAVVGYRFRREIQIYLFARGLCRCCITEESIQDLHFDIFLSFAHEDEDLVLQEMLPELDKRYSVCVHFREWKAGEAIPVQILSSVENSRCTLAILSTAFLQSVWALLEFRTAHMCGLHDGRTRLLVVIIDDNLVQKNSSVDIPEELKAYLATNTYLRWNDDSFWDKLAYSLPPRKKLKSQNLPKDLTPNLTVRKELTGSNYDVSYDISMKESLSSKTSSDLSPPTTDTTIESKSSNEMSKKSLETETMSKDSNLSTNEMQKKKLSTDSDLFTNQMSTKSLETETMAKDSNLSSNEMTKSELSTENSDLFINDMSTSSLEKETMSKDFNLSSNEMPKSELSTENSDLFIN